MAWKRELRERDKEILDNLISCLHRYILNMQEEDYWRWTHSSKGVYSTSEAYKKYKKDEQAQDAEGNMTAYKYLWSSFAPKRLR